MKTSFLFKLSFCLLLVSLMSISLPQAATMNPLAPRSSSDTARSSQSISQLVQTARKTLKQKRQEVCKRMNVERSDGDGALYVVTIILGVGLILSSVLFALILGFSALSMSTLAVLQIIFLLVIPVLVLIGMIRIIRRIARNESAK